MVTATTAAKVAELAALRARLGELAADLTLDALSAVEAEAVLADAAAVQNIAAGVVAAAGRRVDATGAWRRTGDRSAAHYAARVGGIGVGAARTALATAGLLDALPATARAVAAGELSARQAAAIAAAATVDRPAEGRLLRMARSRALADLEEECARVIAAACPDDDAERRRRARSARSCRQTRGPDGSGQITYRSSLDEVAEVWAAIRRFADARFEQARREGVRDTHDNYLADGLLDLARAATAGATSVSGSVVRDDDGASPAAPPPAPARSPADQPRLFDTEDPVPRTSSPPRPAPGRRSEHKVIVRIDWTALVRGHTAPGETSDIAGIGPVPVGVVRDIIASGDAFLAAVVTDGVDVVNVAHLGRRPTAHQRTALEWLGPRCRAEGCGRTVGLEIDHEIPWAEARSTHLAHLDWLCAHHHDLKSHQGWALAPGQGVRPLVAPDDPRHPARAGPPAA